jgi:tetratricopeptide (TPR) repeat protein
MMLRAAVLAWALASAVPSFSADTKPAATFEQVSKAAKAARDLNQDAEAIHLFRQGLRLKPDWDEGLWYLGTLLYEKEEFAEARDLLRHFVAQNPKSGPGWAILALSEYHTREYQRSLEHLQRCQTYGVGDRKELADSVFYVVAVLLTRLEQYDDAMTLLFQLRSAGQAEANIIEPLGLAALRMPLLPAEIPQDRRPMIRLAGAGALALEGQHREEAEQKFRDMIAAYPDEPGVHFLLGAFLLDERPEDGISEMKRELEISPSHLAARLRLAQEYIRQQNFGAALPLAQQALELDPKDSPAHMVLGETLVGKGDLTAGIHELETARDLAPDLTRIRWDLVRAYTAAGRSEDAKREKQEIEKLNQQGAKPE